MDNSIFTRFCVSRTFECTYFWLCSCFELSVVYFKVSSVDSVASDLLMCSVLVYWKFYDDYHLLKPCNNLWLFKGIMNFVSRIICDTQRSALFASLRIPTYCLLRCINSVRLYFCAKSTSYDQLERLFMVFGMMSVI